MRKSSFFIVCIGLCILYFSMVDHSEFFSRTNKPEWPESAELTEMGSHQISALESSAFKPSLLYTEVFGGTLDDTIANAAIDEDQNILYVGRTASTDFPTLSGNDTTHNGALDALVAKFSPHGTMLWSTYLGGVEQDSGRDIKTDSQNNIIVVGSTYSTDFPAFGAFDLTFNGGGRDAFVTKYTPNGSMEWSSFLGGNSHDLAYAVAIDSADNIYISGCTLSTNFPVSGGNDTTANGDYDVFLVKMDPNGSLLWSTFLGGTLEDRGDSLLVNSLDQVYVTGETSSSNFPAFNSNDTTYNGGVDGFIAKFDSTGSFLWSTFIGGAADDVGRSLDLDSNEDIFLTGQTYSDNLPNPILAYSGDSDGFILKIDPNGVFSWNSYFGGTLYDIGVNLIVTLDNQLAVTGWTYSSDFPIKNADDATLNGIRDGYLTVFNASGDLVFSTYHGGNGDDITKGILENSNGYFILAGCGDSSDLPKKRSSESGGQDCFISAYGSYKINIITPINGSTLGSSDIELNFTLYDPLSSWIGYSLDNATNITISGNITLLSLSEGLHSIQVFANDSTGIMRFSRVIWFTIDTIAPIISIITPGYGSILESSDVEIQFFLNEPICSWMGYSLDGVANITITGNLTLFSLLEGPHSIQVFARDLAGNVGSSQVIEFTIQLPDNGSPSSSSPGSTSHDPADSTDRYITPGLLYISALLSLLLPIVLKKLPRYKKRFNF
ncbi:MAG: SBBP repeat-containing protein [Candidatus Hodarchaeota archaeon]